MMMFALIIVGIYQYKAIGEITPALQGCPVPPPCPKPTCPPCPRQESSKDNKIVIIKDKAEPEKKPETKTVIIKEKVVPVKPKKDPIREYDYRKAYDPLEDPTRRVERHFIPPMHVKQMIDIPTRGYPDNYRQVGILIQEGEGTGDNKILRLFGRQEFPGSNRYEYYTAINSGNDQIKVELNNNRGKELYDDDLVNVSELGKEYKVKMHKYDAPKYYPNILF